MIRAGEPVNCLAAPAAYFFLSGTGSGSVKKINIYICILVKKIQQLFFDVKKQINI